jgi:hypothetical protein
MIDLTNAIKKGPGTITKKANRICEGSVSSETRLPVLMILPSSNRIFFHVQGSVNINKLGGINTCHDGQDPIPPSEHSRFPYSIERDIGA